MHKDYFEVCDWWWIDCSKWRRGIHRQPPTCECDYFTDSSIKNVFFFHNHLHHSCPDGEMMPCKQTLYLFLITHNHTTHKILLISLCSKRYVNMFQKIFWTLPYVKVAHFFIKGVMRECIDCLDQNGFSSLFRNGLSEDYPLLACLSPECVWKPSDHCGPDCKQENADRHQLLPALSGR